jgi:hypothetical protein
MASQLPLVCSQAIVPTDVTTGSMQYPVQLPLPPLAIKVTHRVLEQQAALMCSCLTIQYHVLYKRCKSSCQHECSLNCAEVNSSMPGLT